MGSGPVLVVMKQTKVRLGDGRVITLTPGCKSEQVSDALRSRLPKEKVALLKAKGRVVEDTPPW